jgi:hypothetical protein
LKSPFDFVVVIRVDRHIEVIEELANAPDLPMRLVRPNASASDWLAL